MSGRINGVKTAAMDRIGIMRRRIREGAVYLRHMALKKEAGIDGILVTVGLCIIALLLCVVMKESLAGFIETLVKNMTEKAQGILGVHQ